MNLYTMLETRFAHTRRRLLFLQHRPRPDPARPGLRLGTADPAPDWHAHRIRYGLDLSLALLLTIPFTSCVTDLFRWFVDQPLVRFSCWLQVVSLANGLDGHSCR